MPSPPIYALVLSGGGARGAYEAGVVHYMRTALPAPVRDRSFQLLCGSSVGGINTCFLASHAENPRAQGELIRKTWEMLRQEEIYRRDVAAVSRLFFRSFAGISLNIFRKPPTEAVHEKGIHFHGLVDTEPFPRFLKRIVNWERIGSNIARRLLHGVSLTLTNMQSGQLEFFIHKHPEVPYTGDYPVHFVELTWRHAMGGAAIPILFPPVEIGGTHYADGGLRLNTPMSPAIHMGADRVVVIGMHDPAEAAQSRRVAADGPHPPPTLGEILGKILSSIFLDRLDYDLKQMRRINRIVEWGEKVYGPKFLAEINRMLVREGIVGDVASRGLKRLEVLSIFPSRDIRQLFAECISGPGGLSGFSAFEKVLLRLLDVDMHRGQEFLSYFLFLPPYIKALVELGYEDAKKRHDELIAFLSA
ncbi:MAG: patatin-like phospholipase family protein [Deltaproteobacteria bacterium]|nr:patatin-like phospholipase family protein [Deltaproteobacteria bacterium]